MGSVHSLTQESDNTVMNEIQNINEQYTKLVYDSTTNIIANITTSISNNMTSDLSCDNISDQSGAISTGGAEISNTQDCKIDAVYESTLSTLTDNKTSTSQLEEITNDIASKLKNNSSLSTDLTALNSVISSEDTEGEINATVNAIKNIISNIGSTDKKSYVTKTDVETYIMNKNISSVDVENIISNTIKSEIDTITLTNCFGNTTGDNYSNQQRDIAQSGGKITNKQSSYLQSMTTCISKDILSSEAQQNLVKTVADKEETDNSNSADASSNVSTALKSETSETTTSLASIIGNRVVLTLLGIFLLIVIMGIAFLKFLKPHHK